MVVFIASSFAFPACWQTDSTLSFGAAAGAAAGAADGAPLPEDFDDPDGAHYTVGMIKENG